jgi:hypothetical protein
MAATSEFTVIAGGNAASDADTTVSKRFQLVHEIRPELADEVQTATICIEPSIERTLIKVRSIADLSQARRGESAVFVASLRRKRCREIAGKIRVLDRLSASQSMLVVTQPILADLKDLLARIQQTTQEANAREILRQVRDTLMNGQWNLYAGKSARDCVADLLLSLAEFNETVSIDDVYSAADRLESNGFKISGLVISDEQEQENPC